MTHPSDIIDFWFGDITKEGVTANDRSDLWWGKDANIDTQIKQRFEPDLIQASQSEKNDWLKTPIGYLAVIILLDQFSRNIYRNTPQSFATDSYACSLCLKGLKQNIDKQLPFIARVFFYLPLEHAEDKVLQEKSVAVFEKLSLEVNEKHREVFKGYLDFAYQHKEVIDRFGRFPHRNQILGRVSTTEEKEYLKNPGAGF